MPRAQAPSYPIAPRSGDILGAYGRAHQSPYQYGLAGSNMPQPVQQGMYQAPTDEMRSGLGAASSSIAQQAGFAAGAPNSNAQAAAGNTMTAAQAWNQHPIGAQGLGQGGPSNADMATANSQSFQQGTNQRAQQIDSMNPAYTGRKRPGGDILSAYSQNGQQGIR